MKSAVVTVRHSLLFFLLLLPAVSCTDPKENGESGGNRKDSSLYRGSRESGYGTDPTAADTAGLGITRDRALQIALKFLREGAYADQYLADSVTIQETNADWQLFFLHIEWEKRRPNSGLIEVNKRTGRAQWKPLK